MRQVQIFYSLVHRLCTLGGIHVFEFGTVGAPVGLPVQIQFDASVGPVEKYLIVPFAQLSNGFLYRKALFQATRALIVLPLPHLIFYREAPCSHQKTQIILENSKSRFGFSRINSFLARLVIPRSVTRYFCLRLRGLSDIACLMQKG